MNIEIKSRWDANRILRSGEAADTREAVRLALKSAANLAAANLAGANLAGADLAGVREDFLVVLAAAPNEAAGLLTALRDGRVDGSAYEGECACLVGTIANLRGVHYRAIAGIEPDSYRPSERWFLAIRKGDTPATSQVSRITVEWVESWMRDHGQEIPPHVALTWRGDAKRLASDMIAAGIDLTELVAAASAP